MNRTWNRGKNGDREMTKKRGWRLAALFVFLGVAGIGVCGIQAQGSGTWAGVSQCWDGRQWVTVKGNCPAPGGGGGNHTYNPAAREEARAYSRYVASYNRALKLYKQGVPADAARAISLCQSALSYIDDALQNEPNDGNALTLRRQITACISSANGTLAVQKGNYDLGISYYRQAESEYPESNDLWERNIAWAEANRRQAIARQQQAIAEANARAAAERERERQAQINVLWAQGTELHKNNDYKGAEAVWRQVLVVDPQNAAAYSNLGLALRLQRRYAEAETAYRKSLEISPSPGNPDAQDALQVVIDLERQAQQQEQASQPATPAVTDGEELKDALNSGDSTGTGDATNSSPSHEAMDEANSTTVDTDHGLQSTTPEGKITGQNEDVGGGGNKIWDTTGEKSAVSPVDLRGVGKAPSVAKLLSHIPQNDKVKNDKLIQASVTWYGILENTKAETQQNITNIQQQIDNKQGNLYILKIEQTSYTNALKIIDQNQEKAEDVIKKELKNLSMEWVDAPAQQGSETKPDTATNEKQP